MTPRQPGRHALVFVAVTVLLDIIGFGLILPVLPTLLVELTGRPVNEAAVAGGWLAFVYAMMQFIFAPVLGGLSDRFGRRPVLLFAIGALGIDYLVMGFAPTLAWLFLGRALSGIAGASFTPAYAYVADISEPSKRAQAFGVIGACFGIGFIVGPAIGGLLGGFGPRAPFFVAAALSVINFVYGLVVLPESLPPARRRAFDVRRANPLGTLLQMRRHPGVLGLLAALFLWMVGHQVMPSTWGFYTKFRFHWSDAMIGASLAVAGAVMAIAQATLMRVMVPKIGERASALMGIGVASFGYLGYALATQGWMMMALMITWLLGALVMPSTNALMSHRVPPDAQGELQGAVASLFSLASIAGPPLMTGLFSHFAAEGARPHVPGAAFLASTLLAWASFSIYLAATARARTPLPSAPARTA